MRNSWGLELDTSVVRLMHREDRAWAEVAKERIEGADFEERLKTMVALIGHDTAADLLFPRDRIFYADVQIDPGSATRQVLERALNAHMPQQIGELGLDWEVTGQGTVRVAAIALETLKEALDLALAAGIRVGRFSSLADPADFPRPPDFRGRDAYVPLSSLIKKASPDKSRMIPVAERVNGLMQLLGGNGHRFPQLRQSGAAIAIALAAALGTSALLWNALPPESGISGQPLEEESEEGLALGKSMAESAFAALAPESIGTANDLLRQRPPAVHADTQQLSDSWHRSALQAPDDGASITVASPTAALALTQPHVPHGPTEGNAPERLDTADDLLRQRPPAMHADTQQLSDSWRRSALQAPDDGAGITVASATAALALTQPQVLPGPRAEDDAPLIPDIPLPAGSDPSAPATAGRPVSHEGLSRGTGSAIERQAYALRETRDFPEGPVNAGPAPETNTSLSPVPPEFVPRKRPDGVAEHAERLKYGGRTLSELATLRAKPRPASAQQLAVSSGKTPIAANAPRPAAPGMRPGDFDAVVAAVGTQRRLAAAARALQALHAAREAESALVADAEPELRRDGHASRRTPSRSTVTMRATIPNAISLNEMNLVGVYGSTSDRRALVRLPSGRYVRVRVGDRVDGGRVARITESELLYQKGNRTLSLGVPRG